MKNTIYNVNSDNSCTMNISSLSMKRTELRSLSLSKGRSKRHSKGRKLSTFNFKLLTVLFCLMMCGKAWGQTTIYNFEGNSIPNVFTNNSTNPWIVVNASQGSGHNGTYCIKSGNSSVASSTSEISITVNYTSAGTISFLGGCWGEGTSTFWDHCDFYIDDERVLYFGAKGTWETYTFDVTAGTHTFKWSYTKDSSVNPTGDAFFVDDITIDMPSASSSCITTISSNVDWEEFCNCVNSGHDYDGETVHLRANISINSQSNQAGSAGKFFKGTFDGHDNTITVNMTATGKYCAPFYGIQNANINDLVVTGSITSSYESVGGICGVMYGNSSMTNCVSNVDITSNCTSAINDDNGRSTCGGFVGTSGGGDNPTFTGCAFTGSITARRNGFGGFIGFHASHSGWAGNFGGRSTFTNCFCAPTSINTNGITITGSATLSSGYDDGQYLIMTVTNSYYNAEAANMNRKQGKQAYKVTGVSSVTVAMSGTPTTYNVSGITAYSNGIVYGGTIYAGNGDNLSLNLSYDGSGDLAGYSASAGTLSGTATTGNDDAYTLTMPSENVAISASLCGSEPIPYSENFDGISTGTIPTCWTKLGNGTAKVENSNPNSSPNALKFSGATSDNIIVLPQFVEEISNLELSFQTKPEGSYSGDFYVGYVTDPNNASTFVSVDSYNCSVGTTYAYKEYIMSSAPAGSYFAFKHNSGSSSWYWFVDDINVRVAPTCLKPINLTASNITATGATLSWTERGSATNWVLEYGTASDFTGATSVNVNGIPSNALSGLTSETTYYARVKSNCGGGDESEWITCEFTPSNCHALGNGTNKSSGGTYGGIYTYLNYYAYTQQLYTASELGATAGVVESISLHYGETTSNNLTFEVYLGQTTQTSVPTSWITDANLTKVYGPTSTTFTSANNGWKSIDISSANWEWDGTSNILVAIRRTDKTTPSGTTYPNFYHTNSTSPYMMAYVYNSSSSIGLGSNNVATTNGSQNAQRPEIKFCITPACEAPTVSISGGTTPTCSGTQQILTASASGGVSPYSYTWGHSATGSGTTTISSNAATVTVTPSNTGSTASTITYKVTVSDNAGCSASATKDIVVRKQPSPSFSPSATTLLVGGADYNAASTLDADGCSSPSWSSSPSEIVTQAGGSVHAVAQGNTTVTASFAETANYCSASANLAVTVNIPQSVSILASAACSGQETTLTATATGFNNPQYSWSASPNTVTWPANTNSATINVTPTAAGNYTFTCEVTESGGGGNPYSLGQTVYVNSSTGELAGSGLTCYVIAKTSNTITVFYSETAGGDMYEGSAPNLSRDWSDGESNTDYLMGIATSGNSNRVYGFGTSRSLGWYLPSFAELQTAYTAGFRGNNSYYITSTYCSTLSGYKFKTINLQTGVAGEDAGGQYCKAKKFTVSTSVSASTTITVGQSPTINDFPASPVSACGSYDITATVSDVHCNEIFYTWGDDASGNDAFPYNVENSGTYSVTVTSKAYRQYDMITQNGVSAIVANTEATIAVPLTDGIGSNTSAGPVSADATLNEAIIVNGGTIISGSREGFEIAGGVCQSTASVSVTINDEVTPTFTNPGPICKGAALSLPGSSTNTSALTGAVITGTWSPAVNSNATTTYTFTPSANQCSSTATMQVEVRNATTPEFTNPGPICKGAALSLPGSSTNTSALTGALITGTWSPAVNSNATTTYTFTPSANQCSSTATMQVVVNAPNPSASGTYDYIWRGGSTDWNTSANWYMYSGGNYSVASGEMPIAAKNYYIGTGTCLPTDQWPSLSAEATVNNITISGGNVSIPENNTLNIKGNIGVINNGTFTANNNSTVVFCGTSAQIVDGELAFGKLTFNNARGVTLNNDVTVNSLATFTSGIVNGNMTFETSASSADASYTSHVNGTVTKKGNGSSFIFPTGNDNVLGSIQASVETGKTVSVQFSHNSAGFSESEMPRWWNSNDNCEDNETRFDHVSNFEYWKVNTTSALSATITVSAETETEHFNSEATTYNIEDIFAAMWQGCWNNIGGGTGSVSVTHDTIIVSGIEIPAVSTRASEPQWLTLGSKSHSTLLPIELLSFTATCDGRSSLSEWTPATEKNNDYFSLERSDDAINFTEIARIAGAGNSIEPLDYAYTDYGIHGGDNYYRLVQVDYDGTRTVSEIVVANCIEPEVGEPDVQAYPNPFNDELTVVLANFGNRAATIEVYDMLGKLIYTNKVAAPQNSYETILNLSNLPPAAYAVRVSTNDVVINRNVVKQ